MNKLTITTRQFQTLIEFKEYLQKETQLLPEPHNRPINLSSVHKMQDSIERVGVYRAIILVYTSIFSENGEKRTYVIDGQHLRRAILDTNFDELQGFKEVKIIHLNSIDEVDNLTSILNDVGEKWKLDNFLKLWVARDKKSYVTMEKNYLSKKYTSPNAILEASLGHGTQGNGDFKRGNFEIDNERLEKVDSLYNFIVKLGFPETKSSFAGFVRYFNARGGTITVEKLSKGMPELMKQTVFKGNTGRDTYKSFLLGFC